MLDQLIQRMIEVPLAGLDCARDKLLEGSCVRAGGGVKKALDPSVAQEASGARGIVKHAIRLVQFAECHPTCNRETLLLHPCDLRLEVVLNLMRKNGLLFGSFDCHTRALFGSEVVDRSFWNCV